MDEIKIVIALKGTAASVGVQAPECDPVFSTLEGDLPAVLERVPALVDDARVRWGLSPRNPKCETKLEPRPAAPAVTTARSTTRQAEEATKPHMF